MVEFEGVFQLKFSHLTGDYFIYANGSSLFLIGSLDFAVQISVLFNNFTVGTQFEDMGRVQSRSRNAGYHRFFIASLEHGPLDWRKRHGVAVRRGWRPLMSLDCRIFDFIQVNPDTATFSIEEKEQVVSIHPLVLGSARMLMGNWLLTE